ncbi:uncharacterized protein LOC133788651 isoform X2 [Humulus lupulus]|uniref:uncharacterized protein LOC133788651 isoform X2 n=1 Tax=Humulus lupulus TaxID=3486 RepID=UPI002B4078E1|nr:uncharacterized protein LOC133788651 isoform X2 [Humulus lupulus]
MESERLNLPTTFSMSLEVMGHELQFSQDPNSKHLGTTVWDASLVFVKFLEKNCRRGKFSPSKLKGKRVVELGAGCGVAGFGMALLGCDVVMTDQKEVLPLLRRNVERNTSAIAQLNPDSFGSIKVAELSWGNEDDIRAVGPPFDYIIGTDVVGYEIRSTIVHEQMLNMWKENFEVKIVPNSKMDDTYQHPSIQLFIMGSKPQAGTTERNSKGIDQKTDEVETNHITSEGFNKTTDEVETNQSSFKEIDQTTDEVETNQAKYETGGGHNEVEQISEFVDEKVEKDTEEVKIPTNAELSHWEVRRYGSIAARLLLDVKITNT